MDYIDPLMEVRVYQFPHDGPWVFERTRYGREPYRIAFATESEARFFAQQQVAVAAGTLQSMLYGWKVEGVGAKPVEEHSSLEPIFRIEPASLGMRLRGEHGRIVVLISDGVEANDA